MTPTEAAHVSERDIAATLASAINGADWDAIQVEPLRSIADKECARRACAIYPYVGQVLGPQDAASVSPASAASGVLGDIADGYALATATSWDPAWANAVPSRRRISAAVQIFGLDAWAETYGHRLSSGIAESSYVTDAMQDIPATSVQLDAQDTDRAHKLANLFLRNAKTYGVLVTPQPEHERREAMWTDAFRQAAITKIASARVWGNWALLASHGPSRVLAAGLMQLSRGFFVLAWDEIPRFTEQTAQALMNEDGIRAWLDAQEQPVPSWLL